MASTATQAAPPDAHPFDRFQSPAGSFPTATADGWEEAFARSEADKQREKIERDLRGWRGGNGESRSGYSRSAIPVDSYFGTGITGTVGRHLPKEILRVERDWSEGEVCRFESAFPMELEGRIHPHQWTAFVDGINDRMKAAYSTRGAVVDNIIAIATWWTSLLWRTSHFEMHLKLAEEDIRKANQVTFNPVGLNVLSPRHNALQFMEMEYY